MHSLDHRLTCQYYNTPSDVLAAAAAVKENVWKYPRPPRLEQTPKHLRVLLNGEVVADSKSAYRVLETSHPPAYYIPPSDIKQDLVSKSAGGSTFCEWKGSATYWDVTVGGKTVQRRVWSYEDPTPSFQPIKGYLSFYASPFTCFVDDEEVVPQAR
ncbi:hypothetical protein N2152v2_000258 [Parachlorella kessleri]